MSIICWRFRYSWIETVFLNVFYGWNRQFHFSYSDIPKIFHYFAYTASWPIRSSTRMTKILWLYASSPAIFAYYSNFVTSYKCNDLLFYVAIIEYGVSCIVTFISYALCGGSCTASWDLCGVGDLCRSIIIVPLCQDFLDSVRVIAFFELFQGCTLDTLQAYLAFRQTKEVYCDSGKDV